MQKKRICYLADGSSTHTLKFCSYFKDRGYEVSVISLNGGKLEGVEIYDLHSNLVDAKNRNEFKKIGYLGHISEVKRLVSKIKPDILHAQYASSYGLIGSTLGFHPYVISVWGTDIYDFPRRGIIHRKIIEHNFRKADRIFANSRNMACEANKYTDKQVDVTYFGVDLERFKRFNSTDIKDIHNKSTYSESMYKGSIDFISTDIESDEVFTIGTIKSLEKKYGIEYLIRAFKLLKDKYSDDNLGDDKYKNYKLVDEKLNNERCRNDKLVDAKKSTKRFKLKIGGSGSEFESLKALALELGLESDVEFLGRIAPENIAKTFNSFDVSVFPSLREGFGVASIESQACEVPVIVTNVGGHQESLIYAETGFVVEPMNPEAIEKALIKLIEDDKLRNSMGKKGREFVLENFEIMDKFSEIEKIYDEILRE
ncbi:MAG: glycosyltransferase family 4 protein [Clostridioides sp.]|jgi:glycosyltransferase involved in cell wall biosynthesis|nr:glycosyltransferase family 4 protein [Clostridioides sp.]